MAKSSTIFTATLSSQNKVCWKTVDITTAVISHVQNSEDQLQKTTVVAFREKWLLTMIYVKICNAARKTTSTMRCYMYGANFNNLTWLDNDLTPKYLFLKVRYTNLINSLFKIVGTVSKWLRKNPRRLEKN